MERGEIIRSEPGANQCKVVISIPLLKAQRAVRTPKRGERGPLDGPLRLRTLYPDSYFAKRRNGSWGPVSGPYAKPVSSVPALARDLAVQLQPGRLAFPRRGVSTNASAHRRLGSSLAGGSANGLPG